MLAWPIERSRHVTGWILRLGSESGRENEVPEYSLVPVTPMQLCMRRQAARTPPLRRERASRSSPVLPSHRAGTDRMELAPRVRVWSTRFKVQSWPGPWTAAVTEAPMFLASSLTVLYAPHHQAHPALESHGSRRNGWRCILRRRGVSGATSSVVVNPARHQSHSTGIRAWNGTRMRRCPAIETEWDSASCLE
jgi:hypothetical protein